MPCTNTGQDRGEDIGKFREDHQESFGISLGRGDLRQGYQRPGIGQPVLDQAVVRELSKLLDADTGMP